MFTTTYNNQFQHVGLYIARKITFPYVSIVRLLARAPYRDHFHKPKCITYIFLNSSQTKIIQRSSTSYLYNGQKPGPPKTWTGIKYVKLGTENYELWLVKYVKKFKKKFDSNNNQFEDWHFISIIKKKIIVPSYTTEVILSYNVMHIEVNADGNNDKELRTA